MAQRLRALEAGALAAIERDLRRVRARVVQQHAAAARAAHEAQRDARNGREADAHVRVLVAAEDEVVALEGQRAALALLALGAAAQHDDAAYAARPRGPRGGGHRPWKLSSAKEGANDYRSIGTLRRFRREGNRACRGIRAYC